MDSGLNTGAKLEPFLLMAKSARGAAAAKLVSDACAAPGVFVFGELVDTPSIQDLKNHEQHAAHYRLLELFAYGTYADYVRDKETLPALNPAQITKLKQLTLVTLASSHRILAYADLQPALDLPTIRALEDLIIDGIYAGILRARLDQRLQRAEVEYVLGRDVSPAGVPALLAALTDWARTTDDVLGALDTRLAALRTDQAAADAAAAAHRAAVDGRIKEVQEKREKATGTGKGGPATRAAANTADLRGDDMDVDDDGLARASGASKGRKTGRGDENKGVFSRFSKRNRM